MKFPTRQFLWIKIVNLKWDLILEIKRKGIPKFDKKNFSTLPSNTLSFISTKIRKITLIETSQGFILSDWSFWNWVLWKTFRKYTILMAVWIRIYLMSTYWNSNRDTLKTLSLFPLFLKCLSIMKRTDLVLKNCKMPSLIIS